MNLFKRKHKSLFYGDSIEVLLGIKQSIEECSDILSKTSTSDYFNNFKICGDAFENVVGIIDSFVDNWKTDEYNVCSVLKSIKEYISYYIRLCDSSSPTNYNINKKYMVESIETVSIAINAKLNYIKKMYAFNEV